jgi:hypothetical protein
VDEFDEVVYNDDTVEVNTDDAGIEGQVVSYVHGRFTRAEDVRSHDEYRWMSALRNYRGSPDRRRTDPEDATENPADENRSTVFIKITKTKVLAATAQINEVLFGGNKFPIGVEPTIVPEGISESVHFFPNQPAQSVGGPPAPDVSQDLLPGETLQEKQVRLGGMGQKLKPIAGELKEGPGTTPDAITFHPAAVSAKKMEKKIHDQLEESNATKELRYGSFECSLFGTMVMKGPFAVNKEYPSWDEKGEYKPTIKLVPQLSYVPIWNLYPDPDSKSVLDAEYVIERHKLSRSQMRQLANRPNFDPRTIEDVIELGENYQEKWWEFELQDHNPAPNVERFEVLEFWGFIDTKLIREFGVRIPSEFKGVYQLSANIWTCNGRVLRFILNPFKPAYIPYYAVPYEINPYSFFGTGVAETMQDTQALMNAFMRMSVDNAALSGNLVFEIDENALSPGENFEIYPGKIFKRQSGVVGQAITGIDFPNVAAQNMQLFDVARRLSDEATGMPSFAHGQTGVSGVGRTASGISMLMSAANGNVRQVIKNVDDYFLGPVGKGFFHFNMQFDFDPEIKGDLEIRARGTESLMTDEVRSQRLMQWMQVVISGGPSTMPFGNMEYLMKSIATSLDLDADKAVNSLADAALQAKLLGAFAAQMPQPGGATAMPQAGGNMNPQDTTGSGGGNMGTGNAPAPGEPGFSANVS